MRGAEKSNLLPDLDKQIMAALKAADWDEVATLVEALRQSILEGDASKADTNWNAPSVPSEI